MKAIRKIWAGLLVLFGLWAIVGGGECVLDETWGLLRRPASPVYVLIVLIGVAVMGVGYAMLRSGLRRFGELKAGRQSHDS